MVLSSVGIIHLIASVIALVSGTIVLYKLKGSTIHKRIGYIYTISMVVLLATSFMIFRLHGTFGILHWLAVISSLTLICGFLPMVLKKPKNYMVLHISFMYWSVIGLYCAFFAEILTRIPFLLHLQHNIAIYFYALVGVATAIVGGIGSFFYRKYKGYSKSY